MNTTKPNRFILTLELAELRYGERYTNYYRTKILSILPIAKMPLMEKKTKDEIVDLCFKNVDFLLEQNCKIIVVACNTATTNAIKEMRQKI